MSKYVDLPALFQVLVASLLGGAGLSAVYALGNVGVSLAGDGASDDTGRRRKVLGFGLAAVAALVVATGVVMGLYAMVNKPE